MTKSSVLLLALLGVLAQRSAAVGAVRELDAQSFADVLPPPGVPPLLLFLSRPGCSVCEQLDEKWAGIAEEVGSLATLATMNCDPEKGSERFCFSMQSSELSKMDFPRLLLFHESRIYLMGTSVYMAPQLTDTTKDFVRGGYRDRGALEGTYDASKKCLPGSDAACQLSFSFGAGLPVREDCMDLYKQCGKYAEEGKCDMYKNVCEISCGVCRAPPSAKSEL